MEEIKEFINFIQQYNKNLIVPSYYTEHDFIENFKNGKIFNLKLYNIKKHSNNLQKIEIDKYSHYFNNYKNNDFNLLNLINNIQNSPNELINTLLKQLKSFKEIDTFIKKYNVEDIVKNISNKYTLDDLSNDKSINNVINDSNIHPILLDFLNKLIKTPLHKINIKKLTYYPMIEKFIQMYDLLKLSQPDLQKCDINIGSLDIEFIQSEVDNVIDFCESNKNKGYEVFYSLFFKEIYDKYLIYIKKFI